jgi:hypothetical protein
MAKKEKDSKEKEKLALEIYIKEQVEIAKDLITGTEVFLNTIKGIPHEYVMTSIIVADSITEVIQYNKDLLNKPQEDLNLKSKINYNIAEALVVYLSCCHCQLKRDHLFAPKRDHLSQKFLAHGNLTFLILSPITWSGNFNHFSMMS